MKKNPNTPAQNTPHDSGNFATGFFLGALGGALGTLLFSTENGKKILSHLREEFEPQLADVIESPEVKALVEEFETVKEEVTHTVEETKKKFPKFSARQPKS